MEPNVDRPLPGDSLDEEELEDLNTACLEGSIDGEEETLWKDEHRTRRELWDDGVDRYVDMNRGALCKDKQAIIKYLGVEPWISHTQFSKPMSGQRKESDVYGTTIAYFTLPDCKTVWRTLHRRSTYDGLQNEQTGAIYSHTETGIDLPISIPTQLSEKSKARFPRALKILGLRPLDKDSLNRQRLFASTVDQVDTDGKDRHKSMGLRAESSDLHPELIFLVKNYDDPAPYYDPL